MGPSNPALVGGDSTSVILRPVGSNHPSGLTATTSFKRPLVLPSGVGEKVPHRPGSVRSGCSYEGSPPSPSVTCFKVVSSVCPKGHTRVRGPLCWASKAVNITCVEECGRAMVPTNLTTMIRFLQLL